MFNTPGSRAGRKRIASGSGVTVSTDPAGAIDGDGSLLSPLAVKVDGSTIQINGSNELEVINSATTVSVDPAGALDGDGSIGSPLAVKVDGTTIGINGSNELESLVSAGSTGYSTKLEEHSASGSSSLDFTAWRDAAYDIYVIEIIGIVPANDGDLMYMRFSTDGGATYSSTDYKWAAYFLGSNGSAGNNTGPAVGTTSQIRIAGAIENTAASSGVYGTIKLFRPADTTRFKACTFHTAYQSSDGNAYEYNGHGWWHVTSDIDAVRFLMSSGNITEGTIRIYGISA